MTSKMKDERGPIVVWFRNDLRMHDNPALLHAAEDGREVLVAYVLDDGTAGVRPLGGAHRWWLHHSLTALAADLKALGCPLVLRRGDGQQELVAVAREAKASAIFLNRRYEPGDHDAVARLREALEGIEIEAFTGHLLHDPDRIRTKTGGYYKVYTPFRKAFTAGGTPRDPLPAPTRIHASATSVSALTIGDLDLLPTKPDWSGGIAKSWEVGEAAAIKRFSAFCKKGLRDYKDGRERPDIDGSSRMSPHLRFGEISPYTLWAMAGDALQTGIGLETFRSELLWRDFNYHLLWNEPSLPERNYAKRFDALAWRDAPAELAAWQQGLTGYPIVDAGMRQLWQTGWMHNRVRMIVGSFLTRDLLIDWKAGERWFWDTLVDGDPASNTSQWQWIAGTGADPQPFFRIFNPIAQSRKFDPHGAYIRRFVPELARLSDEAIHAPFELGSDILRKAGVELGHSYPRPIVDHGEARRRALEAYAATRG